MGLPYPNDPRHPETTTHYTYYVDQKTQKKIQKKNPDPCLYCQKRKKRVIISSSDNYFIKLTDLSIVYARWKHLWIVFNEGNRQVSSKAENDEKES